MLLIIFVAMFLPFYILGCILGALYMLIRRLIKKIDS